MNNIDAQKTANRRSTTLKFRHILIITYGRSGSTLLQGVLNGIEGVVLRGENDNAFFDLYKTYKKLLDLKEKKRGKALEPSSPRYGISLFEEQELLARLQDMARVILLADQYDNAENLTYGFKEIRYNEVGDEFEAYLDFLSQLFPHVAFIFNTRDHQAVASSGWWKDDERSAVIAELSALETRFKNYASEKDSCFSIKYEDVTAGGAELRNLFDFLGAQYQPEVIERILNTPHSYGPEQKHIKKLFQQRQRHDC